MQATQPSPTLDPLEGLDARHDRAADAHDEDSRRHDQAAWFWSAEGDADRARLAGRDAILDRELADVDRERARLERRRETAPVPYVLTSGVLAH